MWKSEIAKTTGIDKPQLPSRRQSQHRMGMPRGFLVTKNHLYSAGHSQVDDPLRAVFSFIEVEDDVFAHPVDPFDLPSGESLGHFGWAGFKRLPFRAEPD